MPSDYLDYEKNLAFPPQEVKSQDDIRKQETRSSDVLIKAVEKCEKLEEENNKLKQAINYLGGRKCHKCGEYHHRQFICWNCGYDHTISKELDK